MYVSRIVGYVLVYVSVEFNTKVNTIDLFIIIIIKSMVITGNRYLRSSS